MTEPSGRTEAGEERKTQPREPSLPEQGMRRRVSDPSSTFLSRVETTKLLVATDVGRARFEPLHSKQRSIRLTHT